MLAVTDTSPVRALSSLGLLAVMPALIETVLMPPAVQMELDVDVAGFGRVRVGDYPWVQIAAPVDVARVIDLRRSLGHGESEAIVLGAEWQVDALLIDDADARRAATRLGLTPVGTLGLLVRAKQAGLIPTVGPLIDRLVAEMSFRVSPRVRRFILELAQE